MNALRVLALAMWVSATLFTYASLTGQRAMPRCQEDAVLIGTGTFDDGRWSQYICGPAVDDYTDSEVR